MNLLTVFRLIIYLLNENNVILSYDEIVLNHKNSYTSDTHLIYLMSERVRNLSLYQQSKSKFVRIDSYVIKETNAQYISSWFFNVSFSFLPVNRLAVDCGTHRRHSYISIDANITDLSSIRAIIVIFGKKSKNIFVQANRVLFKDERLPTTLEIHSINHDFEFIRMFHNFSRSFYYLVSIHKEGTSIFVNTSIISRNLCPNVSEIFNETILSEYSYLKRLKLYHLPCQKNKDLRCFFG